MRVLLVGVSCVGKTTMGRILAEQMSYPFFDLDAEIEHQLGASIERLQQRYLTEHGYRQAASGVLKRILDENPRVVVALPPSGLRDAYLVVLKRFKDRVVVAISDSPQNILSRITFFDVESKPAHVELDERLCRYHLGEIKKDLAYFGRTYRRAQVQIDIDGLDAEAGASRIHAAIKEWREVNHL
jgi:shikimate kinase